MDFYLKIPYRDFFWKPSSLSTCGVFCDGTCKRPWTAFVWLELTATFPVTILFLLNFFQIKVIAEEAILSEDTRVHTGDLLKLSTLKKNGLQVGLSGPLFFGEGQQVETTSPSRKRKKKHNKKQYAWTMLSFKFYCVCWFLSLLAGSHLTGTCYNYLKPYSLFIPHFVRVVCRLAWSVCIRCRFQSGSLYYQECSTSECKLPPASLRQGCITEYLSNLAVSVICRTSSCILPVRVVVETLSCLFQIIANHCHLSTKMNAVLKNVILNEHFTPLDAQRKRAN